MKRPTLTITTGVTTVCATSSSSSGTRKTFHQVGSRIQLEVAIKNSALQVHKTQFSHRQLISRMNDFRNVRKPSKSMMFMLFILWLLLATCSQSLNGIFIPPLIYKPYSAALPIGQGLVKWIVILGRLRLFAGIKPSQTWGRYVVEKAMFEPKIACMFKYWNRHNIPNKWGQDHVGTRRKADKFSIWNLLAKKVIWSRCRSWEIRIVNAWWIIWFKEFNNNYSTEAFWGSGPNCQL